jgi:putative flippase GtrA/SAM-dependent methyltransferase
MPVTLNCLKNQALKFAATGAVATIIDFLVFGVLLWLETSPLMANACAWATSFVVSYAINSRVTFGQRPNLRSFVYYLSTSIVTLLVSSACILVVLPLIGAWPAKLLAVAISYVVGFTLAKNYAFRATSQDYHVSHLPFQMPSTGDHSAAPEWNGSHFIVDGKNQRVLAYRTDPSGWNDELTRLHEEETAGGSFFIDTASRQIAIQAIKNSLPRASGATPVILEVGVSGSHLLKDMQRAFPNATILGADYTGNTLNDIADSFPGVPLVQMDLTQSPFPTGQLDIIVALNVLEHIDQDEVAMQHCFRMLKPGGAFVVEVPAGPKLFDSYDEELMHFRRYDRDELTSKLKRAGFEIEYASHIGFFIYPAFWLSKKRSQRRGKVDANHVKGAISSARRFDWLGRGVMALEHAISRITPLPIGIRCTAIARKKP